MAKKKKWSVKYKRSINCSNPKGFSQKQYCKRKARGGKYKSEEVMKEEDLELELLEKKKKKKKAKKKKDDRCTRIAKRKYDVWPSAYASGAVVQCRRGKIWRGLKEEDDPSLNTEYQKLITELVLEQLNLNEQESVTAQIVDKVRDELDQEGGAAGSDAVMGTLKDLGVPEDFPVDNLLAAAGIAKHEKGDYIDLQGIEKENLDEKKKKRKKRKKAGTESSKESSLRDWFGRKGAPGKKGGWVDCNAPIRKKGKIVGYKPCGRSKGEKRSKYPACRPTPAACKERGRGKSWGKKAAKKKKTNEAVITESMIRQVVITEMQKKHFLPGLLEHVQKGIPVHQNFYRVGSPCFFNMFKQARHWAKKGLYEVKNEDERWFLEQTDIGETAIYEGQEVQLDFPMLMEAEYRGKKVELNKPKRGGSKKFYVYVKDGDKVKKVSFGSPDMPLNISDDEARASFVARHKCKEKKPRTSAGYWACRTGRYPHLTGSKKRYNWW